MTSNYLCNKEVVDSTDSTWPQDDQLG